MWLPEDFPFKIIGKIRLTPEQAEKTFGFKMKRGGDGVVLQRRGSKICIRTYRAHKKSGNECSKKFAKLAKFAKEHREDIIKPIYDPIARNISIMSGTHLFLKVNLKKEWQHLKQLKHPSCHSEPSEKSQTFKQF